VLISVSNGGDYKGEYSGIQQHVAQQKFTYFRENLVQQNEESAGSSQMPAPFYQAVWCHILEPLQGAYKY
jgi:hypothetical protein